MALRQASHPLRVGLLHLERALQQQGWGGDNLGNLCAHVRGASWWPSVVRCFPRITADDTKGMEA
jgi:hypothetical protein